MIGVEREWQTADVRPGRASERRYDVLLHKR